MKKLLGSIAMLGLAASVAIAGFPPDPYFVRGEFNGWDNSTDPMIDMGGGMWSYTVTGLNPGQSYEFKATVDDWSYNAPGSNAKAPANASGEIVVNFFPENAWADGWEPSAKPRLGYADPGMFGWELIGDMNGWSGGAAWHLADLGGGLHRGDFLLAAGSYEFKFRQQGSWDHNVGDDLGNSAANNSITLSDPDLIAFELDLPNGRWRTWIVPEPTALLLLGLGGLVALRRR